jgi:von Willebrand factor type A domain
VIHSRAIDWCFPFAGTGVEFVVWVIVIGFITASAAAAADDAGAAAPARAQKETQEKGASSPSKSSEKKADVQGETGARPKKEGAKASRDGEASSSARKTGKTKKQAKGAGSKTAKKSNRDAEVRVLTQEEMKKPRSAFLRPPGSSPEDRYGDDSDWYELPAWRKTTFFGIRARGRFFVYVADCSLSMLDDDRLTRATIEVRRSVFSLVEPQKFEVIFYNNESIPMPGGPRARTADLQAKNQLVAWLQVIEPDGGTDPRVAIKQAISLKPDAVFLLSDGEFPEGTVDEVAKLNARKIPIHCIDLAGGLAGDHLQRIAAGSGGQYASRPGSLHVAPPSRMKRP